MVLLKEDFDDTGIEIHHDEPQLPPEKPEFTPYDAMMQAKQNPSNVLITKYQDDYYIGHDDLKKFMDAKKTDDYEDSVDCIVKAHQCDTPDICADNVKVLMGCSDLKNCSQEEVNKLESANINVFVY